MTSILERYVDLHPGSERLAARAHGVFPDGVTHDIRRDLPFSLYCERGSGSRKRDVDGNELVDYVMGHGALLLGHNFPAIEAALAAQLPRGTHYGASHEMEVAWGEEVRRLVPSAKRVRFTSSGTEATMMALRLARNFTGRERVLRFREHFHGWNDSVTGQPGAEGTMPESAGLSSGALAGSVVVQQNDLRAMDAALELHGSELAAMILEPTGAHWGEDPIETAFVEAAVARARAANMLVVFDEVITGFRVSAGGAQQAYGITPDLTTMAKIVAGGLPGGCVAGRSDILDQIAFREDAPRERIAHPGTFNANPLSATAGTTCLRIIGDGAHQERAAGTAEILAKRLNAELRDAGVRGCVYGYSSMLHVALGANEAPPDGYSWRGGAAPRVAPCPPAARQALRLGMVNEGVHLMGDGLMVSSVHGDDDVDRTLEAFRATLGAMKDQGVAP